jgi:hypothetical protein
MADRRGAGGRGAPRGWLVGLGLVAAAAGTVVLLARGEDRGGPWPSPAPTSGRGASAPARTTGFEDRTEAAGIAFRTKFLPEEQGANFKVNLYDHGCGIAVGDVDGDGVDDVYLCNQLGPNALYRNRGDGTFEDVTSRAGDVGLGDRVSVSAVFADYDADGDEDLYVTTTMGGNALLRNDGHGKFEDVTKAAGVGLVAHSQSATFFDADGDGDLDLLVSDTAKWTLDAFDRERKYYPGPQDLFELITSPPEENRYFRNRGDGTFEDATREAGLAGTGWSGDTAVFDFDEDGDLDVLVANMFGSSALYRNDGKGRFTDVHKEALGLVPWGTVGAKAFDYDADGHLDLLVVDMHSDMWMDFDWRPTPEGEVTKYRSPTGPLPTSSVPAALRKVLQRLDADAEGHLFGNALYHALGGGKFEEVSARARVETLWPWGVADGDFDGDGWEDVFVPSGMGWPYRYVRSPLLVNRGDGTFRDATTEAGLDPPPGGENARTVFPDRATARSARCAVTADFDGDGRLDLLVGMFNDRVNLFMNRWPARSWVGFRLVGRGANREAIGAVVRLRVGGKTLTRQVQAAGGYLAQSSRTLHFGLGDATRVDSAEVTWPDGTKQTLGQVRLGVVNRVEPPR